MPERPRQSQPPSTERVSSEILLFVPEPSSVSARLGIETPALPAEFPDLSFEAAKLMFMEQRRPFDEARLFCLRPPELRAWTRQPTSEIEGPGAPPRHVARRKFVHA